MFNSTERFTDRVANYVKFRPHYPKSMLELCQKQLGLQPGHIIADIGSGTGISSELFVHNGNQVYGVEPNTAMREASEAMYADYSNFQSVVGRAEATTLADNSVDYIIVGQAFHWFDHDTFEIEARRILKPQGWIVIMWNSRLMDSGFNEAYEGLCKQFGMQYSQINHMTTRSEVILNRMEKANLKNAQQLDLNGLIGRFMSSSYAPKIDDDQYEGCVEAMKQIFTEFETDGKVTLRYTTEIFYEQI